MWDKLQYFSSVVLPVLILLIVVFVLLDLYSIFDYVFQYLWQLGICDQLTVHPVEIVNRPMHQIAHI